MHVVDWKYRPEYLQAELIATFGSNIYFGTIFIHGMMPHNYPDTSSHRRYKEMKLLTVLYLMGGITLFGMILLMMNLTDSGSMLDNLKTQVVYEPDNLSTLSYDKIILVTSADKLSRDPVRNKESRDSVRNTWMKDLGSRETHGVFFVCILTGTDNEVQRKLEDEAEKEKDMVILRTPSNPNQYSSGNVAAMDWARDRFNYNVMLTVDHMTLVNISELDTQIEVIGKYNITGDSPLSKVSEQFFNILDNQSFRECRNIGRLL